jgi:hypothetical protein
MKPMLKQQLEGDPRGLIFESYRIDGIGPEECRSIFLDWALGVPAGEDERGYISGYLAKYEPKFPDHPMTKVLKDALEAPRKTKRRGGARGRR